VRWHCLLRGAINAILYLHLHYVVPVSQFFYHLLLTCLLCISLFLDPETGLPSDMNVVLVVLSVVVSTKVFLQFTTNRRQIGG